jgi:hypothetical protein
MLKQKQEILLQGIIDGDYQKGGISLGEWAVNCARIYSSGREFEDELQRLKRIGVIDYRVESSKNFGSSEDEIYITDYGHLILQDYKIMMAIENGSFSQSRICDAISNLQNYEAWTAINRLKDLGLLKCTEGAAFDGDVEFTDVWLTKNGSLALNNSNQWWASRMLSASMPDKETAKFIQNNYGSQSIVTGIVEGDQNIYAPPDKQTLAQVLAEIQKLLQQLEQSNPAASEAEKEAFVTIALSPTVRQRAVSALQSGGKAAIEEFLDNPYVNVAIAVIEGWRKA